ncbi:ribonuclease H-like protein [Panus rudis PR-1116 ss-1]|nr:ribonuclease H-like protein [Panus rudis PR-1116 ss-1]
MEAQESPSADDDNLPLYSYEEFGSSSPTVVYTRHEHEANDLVQCLQGPLGFDMEWRIFMRRGAPPSERPTSLIQLCDTKLIVLIQLSDMSKVPQKVKELIENPDVVKTGANSRNDGMKLFRDFGILAENLVELGALARQADPIFSTRYKRSIVSLARMVAMYTQRTLDKGSVRTGNWEKAPLTAEQKRYAANDAHSGLMVYHKLIDIARENGRTLSPESYTSNLRQDYHAGLLIKASSRTMAAVSRTVSVARINSSAGTTSTNDTVGLPTSQPLLTSVTSWACNVEVQPGDPPKYQHRRAYELWHHRRMTLDAIRAALRTPENPLAQSTVISYVVRHVQANPALPFDMVRLKELVQSEAGSWQRHRDWIMEVDSILNRQ